MHAHFNMTLLSTFTCVKHPSAVPTYAPCYVLIDNSHCLACDQCDYSKNIIAGPNVQIFIHSNLY